MAALKSGELKAPDRIVVSLPPLGVAEAAFRIRDFVNQTTDASTQGHNKGQRAEVRVGASLGTPAISHSPSAIRHSTTTSPCEVCVDIMDAWPETFYQVIPKPLRKTLGPILMAPMHRSAKRAYQGADKISAVGQSYLDLAEKYLGSAGATRTASMPTNSQSAINHPLSKTLKPMFLCYHGTDLERFQRDKNGKWKVESGKRQKETSRPSPLNKQQTTNTPQPLKAVYLGAMGSGYDLQTIIDVATRWKAEGVFPFQIHFAGTGAQLGELTAEAQALGLSARDQNAEDGKQHEPSDKSVASTTTINDSERIIFHGQLGRDAVNELLLSADLALVPNRPDSLVACPYKAGEYAAAGLPMISCLGGELGQLLDHWNAGSEYNEGDTASLQAAFEDYSEDLELLKHQSLNAHKMAAALFDRSATYTELAEFILKATHEL